MKHEKFKLCIQGKMEKYRKICFSPFSYSLQRNISCPNFGAKSFQFSRFVRMFRFDCNYFFPNRFQTWFAAILLEVSTSPMYSIFATVHYCFGIGITVTYQKSFPCVRIYCWIFLARNAVRIRCCSFYRIDWCCICKV